jgi:putative serine protease PepD
MGSSRNGPATARARRLTTKVSGLGVRLGSAACLVALALAGCTSGTSTPATLITTTPTPIQSAGGASALEERFISVIERVGPSVVAIESDSGLGSGVIVDNEGDIVTNAHVVAGATGLRVILGTGKSYTGSLVGTFGADDLAVVRINAPGLVPATFGDSDHLRVGSIVMAMGSPLGLQSSVTEGIVSALGRQVTEPNGVALPPLIQTSADINPGNSGGALVDLSGEVIGIPTLAAQDPQVGGTAPGIGFAIPSNVAKDIAAQFVQYGRVVSSRRAYLGIQSAGLADGQGVLIYTVKPGGPADRAGLKADEVITVIDGKATPDQLTLASVLAGLRPGQTVEVKITRPDGSEGSLPVTLGELPA